MKKRVKLLSSGQRPVSFIDGIDMDVLGLLHSAQQRYRQEGFKTKYKGMNITLMCNFLIYQHKTLKPHVDKMIKMNFVEKDETQKGNITFYKVSKRGLKWLKACSDADLPIPSFHANLTKKYLDTNFINRHLK